MTKNVIFHFAFAFCLFEICISSDPTESKILRNEYKLTDNGYQFSYETSDGQKRDEVAFLSDIPDVGNVLVIQGSYSYIKPDGTVYKVIYTADQNGYQPHLVEEMFGYKGEEIYHIDPNLLKSLVGK